jgi:acetyl-CoA carboxylase beta subunit
MSKGLETSSRRNKMSCGDFEMSRRVQQAALTNGLITKCKICGDGVYTLAFVSQGVICTSCQANLDEEKRIGAGSSVRAENHVLRGQLEEQDATNNLNMALKAKTELLEEENKKLRRQLGKQNRTKSFPIDDHGKRKLDG